MLGGCTGRLTIDGSTTDATRSITLMGAPSNRHSGVPWNLSGSSPHAVVDNGSNSTAAIQVLDDFVTIESLEVKGGSSTADLVSVNNLTTGVNAILLRQNLLHDGPRTACASPTWTRWQLSTTTWSTTWRDRSDLVPSRGLGAGSRIQILNNTVAPNIGDLGLELRQQPSSPNVLLRNNMSSNARMGADFAFLAPPTSTRPVATTLHKTRRERQPQPGGGGINSIVPDLRQHGRRGLPPGLSKRGSIRARL